MAPSRTPRVKKKEGDYSNIGQVGRKTGAILKDTGIRDANGMEPLDGIFSSPEKSPPKRNGVKHDSTITEDETMDMGESTIPEPTEVLNGHRHGRTVFPPPRSRSPIKTHLNSAPRRSVGPMSSPSRPLNHDTPTRASSHPPNRKLFGSSDLRPSVEQSTQKGGLKRINMSSGKKGKKRPFDLSLEDEKEEDDEVSRILNGQEMTNGKAYDDSAPIAMEDDSLEMPQANDDQDDIGNESFPQDQEQDLSVSPEPEPTPEPVANIKKRRGRPSRVEKVDFDEPQTAVAPEKPPKRGGRQAKKAKTQMYQDEEPQEEPESSKVMEQATPVQKSKAPPKKSKASKPTPSLRDPNAKIKAAPRGREKQPSVKPMPPPPLRNGRPQPRSLQILRSETPADDEGARTTRFGRHSVKPLAFWRGERFVYGEGHIEGKELTLPAIKEIIRTEEVEVPRPKRSTYRRPAPKRQRLEDLEEDDEDREPWEMETGIVRAQVMQWDPMTGRGDEERVEEADVAYASEAIEMRDINNADFRFAKTLTLPFFGSGMVDLPPGGEKRVKNSRKMQMVFFVFYGRVTVDLGTPMQRFGIGKGGMWQVPRGNFYSIANNSKTKPARIFFAQGCEVAAEPSADESIVG